MRGNFRPVDERSLVFLFNSSLSDVNETVPLFKDNSTLATGKCYLFKKVECLLLLPIGLMPSLHFGALDSIKLQEGRYSKWDCVRQVGYNSQQTRSTITKAPLNIMPLTQN